MERELIQNIKPEYHEPEIDEGEVEKHLQVGKFEYAPVEAIIEHYDVHYVKEDIEVRCKVTLTGYKHKDKR
jgi:hypothetical protein